MTQSIDELVKIITQRVVEKLKETEGLGVSTASLCVLGADGCKNCGLCIIKKPEAVEKIVSEGADRISSSMGVTEKFDTKLASMIDHTILKPDVTRDELKRVCDEARKYHFATVCVNSSNIPYVAQQLSGSGVKPIAVVGFPLGAATALSKAFEAKEAIKNGAEEIDMVINIGALKSKDYKTVYEDISRVVEASRPHKVKVILETSSLDHDEKVAACVLSKTAGAAFVKTSTGFASGGATAEDIALMRKIVGSDMEVKASGGIRSKADAEAMVKAGANRIGASASVAIVTGKDAGKGKY